MTIHNLTPAEHKAEHKAEASRARWRELAAPPAGCPFELHRWLLQPGETVVWAEVIEDGNALAVETETQP